jgi:hypothetical protein
MLLSASTELFHAGGAEFETCILSINGAAMKSHWNDSLDLETGPRSALYYQSQEHTSSMIQWRISCDCMRVSLQSGYSYFSTTRFSLEGSPWIVAPESLRRSFRPLQSGTL